MSNSRPLDAVASATMVLICLCWGFNQVATKLALPEIPPLTQAALRSLGALPLVAAWAWSRRVPLFSRDGTLWPGILAGALFALEFLLIYRGLLWTTASRAIVFVYTAPFFVALGAGPMLGERLSVVQWSGLALSFTGVALAIGVPEARADATMLMGDLLTIGGGAAWGATTLVIKQSRLGKIAPEKTLGYQLLVSIPLLALGAWGFGERFTAAPGAVAVGALAYQTFWVVAVTYSVWFALVQRYSASRLSSYTFLTPLFGVAAGHLVLGDPITPAFAGAVALVLAGLVLVNRPQAK